MVELLKSMSEINSVSGNEWDIRDFILSRIKDKADEITVDTMGNVIALKKGTSSDKKIAVTANMDEPGFIVSGITDEGYVKFKAVGDVDPRKLVSKKIVIGKKKVKGIIGMKAIHLQTKSEREEVVKVSKLFIDIGAKDKSEAEDSVRLGDYISFDTEFCRIGDAVKGKALDRSGGCAALLKVVEMQKQPEYDTYFCFLTQREVGSRGAKIVSERVGADVVLTVSSAETNDMYGSEQGGIKLGKGIVLGVADRSVLSDRELTKKLASASEKANIKTQNKVLPNNISDGGAMQTSGEGRRCVNAYIPCRYSHSPVSLMSLGDVEAMAGYVELYIDKIGEMI